MKPPQLTSQVNAPLTPADDDWVECVLCEEEVLLDDPGLTTCLSGEWICPTCREKFSGDDEWQVKS